ncbi:MAG: tetratricopeptide repeat protein, partial [Candidatus Eremiobacterota bacterium]
MKFNKIIGILFVMTVLLIIMSITAEGESALDYYSKGNEYLTNMDFNEALNYFNKALAINPDYVEALIGKGMALYKLEELEKAKNCFIKVMKLKPSDKIGWYGTGLVYLEQKKYDVAIQYFDEALKIDNGFKKARERRQEALNGMAGQYISKADELFSMKKYSEAINYYNKALVITPTDEYALKKKADAKKALSLQQVTPKPTTYIAKITQTPQVNHDDKLSELLQKGNKCYDRKEY